MDALSIARTQAALALSASYYQDETVSKLLLERETLAMEAEDLRDFAKPLLTKWQTRHYVLRAALFELSIGYADRAEQILKRELGELPTTRKTMKICRNILNPNNCTEQSNCALKTKGGL